MVQTDIREVATRQHEEGKTQIEEKIFTIRSKQVMIDKDLALLYGVETRRLNEQVKRNIERFPDDFMFRLTQKEFDLISSEHLKSQIATSNWGGTRKLPLAFTENGIAMLSSILKSETAIAVNIRIMRAFTAMRRTFSTNHELFQRIETIEYHQLKIEQHLSENDGKIERILNHIETDGNIKQGIFFDGQIYDAYTFVADLVRKAARRIVLIDNYIDDTVLTMLSKRADGVEATIYTGKVSKQLQLDIDKHNAQYPPITIRIFSKAHDRFLIIDDAVYLVGASIKDLGKKWFGFTLMENTDAEELIEKI